jgi:hypothetical protein
MTDELREWEAGWSALRERCLGGPGRSVDLVLHVFDGDIAGARAVTNAVSDAGISDFVNGSLALCYMVARRFRSNEAMLKLLADMMAVETDAPQRDTQLGATLALAHVGGYRRVLLGRF